MYTGTSQVFMARRDPTARPRSASRASSAGPQVPDTAAIQAGPSAPLDSGFRRNDGCEAFLRGNDGVSARPDMTTARDRPMARRVNGRAIRWAWRSPKRKVKKGNSVISCPGGSGGMTRVLRQKSNPAKGTFWTKAFQAPTTSCTAPSRLPRMTTKTAPAMPATAGESARRSGRGRISALGDPCTDVQPGRPLTDPDPCIPDSCPMSGTGADSVLCGPLPSPWIPAFAGMTCWGDPSGRGWVPAFAGTTGVLLARL